MCANKIQVDVINRTFGTVEQKNQEGGLVIENEKYTIQREKNASILSQHLMSM